MRSRHEDGPWFGDVRPDRPPEKPQSFRYPDQIRRARLGHGSVNFTLATYVQKSPGRGDREAAVALGKLIRRPPRPGAKEPDEPGAARA